MSSVSLIQIRIEPRLQCQAPGRTRQRKPVKQKGWNFETAYPPPGVDAEENMWRSCHRLERAVAEFFRKNPDRVHFVAAIETVPLAVPSLTLSRQIVVANCSRAPDLPEADSPGCELWICAVPADDVTYQFYARQVDEETAIIAFDLLSRRAELTIYVKPEWDCLFGDWDFDYVTGPGPQMPNFPRGILSGEVS
jgi:hypothetical protein